MGYYTYHYMHIYDVREGDYNNFASDEDVEKIMKFFQAHCEDANYALEEDGSGADSSKWYESEQDMAFISSFFPGFLFALHGDGDDREDQWTCFGLNGKSYVEQVEFVYPVFDVEILNYNHEIKKKKS